MPNQSEDRRARRSRRLLKQGLMELLHEKRFSEISVRDITERMDLNRGTFYLHYPDTAALLRSLQTDILQDIQTMMDEHLPETDGGTFRPVLGPILDYVAAHRDTCQAVLGDQVNGEFLDRLHDLIDRNGAAMVRRRFGVESEAQMKYLLSFATYGLIGLIKEWLDTGLELSKEQVLLAADQLLTGGAREFLQPGLSEQNPGSNV